MPDSALPLKQSIASRRSDPDWTSPLASAFLLITIGALAGATWLYHWNAPGVDFTNLWAAGRLAAGGQPSLAYDAHAHRAVEMTAATMGRAIPFLYPPPFLFAVMPFGFQPYWLAYLLWVTTTGAIYVATTRRLVPAHYALGYPAAFDNVIFGQAAFLTCSAFVVGTALLESTPLLGGAVLGLFVCKPQLACLFPVALLASRNWRGFCGGAMSSIFLIVLAGLVFGFDCYTGLLGTGPRYVTTTAQGPWPWNQVASLFGAARYLGASQGVAFILQAVCASVAVGLTWRAWARKLEQRVPILAAATMLVSPYLFTYDSLLLIVPIGWFLRERMPARAALVWLLSLLTVLCLFNLCPTPNLTPLAAMISLWWLHSDGVPRWRITLRPVVPAGA